MEDIKLTEDLYSTIKKTLIGNEKVSTVKGLAEKVNKEPSNLSRQIKNPSYRLLLQLVDALGYDLFMRKKEDPPQ